MKIILSVVLALLVSAPAPADYSIEHCDYFKQTYAELEELATRGIELERGCESELQQGIHDGEQCQAAHALLGEYLALSDPLRADLLAASRQADGFDCRMQRSGIIDGYVREVWRVNAMRQRVQQEAERRQEAEGME